MAPEAHPDFESGARTNRNNSAGSVDTRSLGNLSDGIQTMPSETDVKGGPLCDGGHSKDTEIRPRHRWRRNDEDVRRWAELFQSGITIVHIAEKYHVDPNTISKELHKLV